MDIYLDGHIDGTIDKPIDGPIYRQMGNKIDRNNSKPIERRHISFFFNTKKLSNPFIPVL